MQNSNSRSVLRIVAQIVVMPFLLPLLPIVALAWLCVWFKSFSEVAACPPIAAMQQVKNSRIFEVHRSLASAAI